MNTVQSDEEIILDFILKNSLDNQFSYGEYVSHYTSWEALKSIIDKQNLWFTHYQYVNDSEELNYNYWSLINILKNKYESSDKNQFIYNHIIPMLKSMRNYLKRNYGHFYIFSTSTSQDSKTMWQGYGKDNKKSAYSISFFSYGLKEDLTEKLIKEFNKEDLLKHGRIIYNKGIIDNMLCNYISVAFDIYNSLSSSKEINYFIKKVKENIMEYSLFIKDQNFKDEEEYRFLLCFSNKDIEKLKANKEHNGIKYFEIENLKGTLIPKIEIKFSNNCIRLITFGPYDNKENAKRKLRKFLDSKDLQGISINKSLVPIRNTENI